MRWVYIISRKYGNKGLEIAQEAYYNIYKENISDKDIIEFLEENISQYSIDIEENKSGKPLFNCKYYKEIIPEILAKDKTNQTVFTHECKRLLKKVIL